MIASTPLENLSELFDKMRPYLLAAGIPEKQLRIKKIKFKTDSVAKAFDWLHELSLSPEFHRMRYAWNLLPPHVWDNYKKMGFRGMREQLILESASEKMCELWRKNRPSVFGTAKKKAPKDDSKT